MKISFLILVSNQARREREQKNLSIWRVPKRRWIWFHFSIIVFKDAAKNEVWIDCNQMIEFRCMIGFYRFCLCIRHQERKNTEKSKLGCLSIAKNIFWSGLGVNSVPWVIIWIYVSLWIEIFLLGFVWPAWHHYIGILCAQCDEAW